MLTCARKAFLLRMEKDASRCILLPSPSSLEHLSCFSRTNKREGQIIYHNQYRTCHTVFGKRYSSLIFMILMYHENARSYDVVVNAACAKQ